MPDTSYKSQGSSNIIDQLIKLNSFLLIFFTFSGVGIPFQGLDVSAAYEAETTNIPNQILYLFLFFSSLVVVIKRFDKTLSFIRDEKYLSLFILLCLVSAVWSDHRFLSIKRSFQLFVMFIVITEALINIDPKILLKQLKIVVSLYLFFNLFSCLFISDAVDPVFKTWRGIELTKNILGQSSFYCLLSSIVFFNFERTKLAKYYDLALMLIAAIIINKSHSSSSYVALSTVILLGFIFQIDTFFKELKIGRSFSGFILLFSLSLIVVINIFASHIIGLIPAYFGKDLTLSGRTFMWEYVWTEIQKKLILGYGFATYWIMGESRAAAFAAIFGYNVNEAHNGYLEIMLQLGVVGFISFLFQIIAYIYRMLKLKSNLAILVLVAILTLNYTESVLFKIGSGVTTFIFLASYISISVFHFNLGKVNSDEENH